MTEATENKELSDTGALRNAADDCGTVREHAGIAGGGLGGDVPHQILVTLWPSTIPPKDRSGVIPLLLEVCPDGEEPNCWLSVANKTVHSIRHVAEHWEDWATGGRERSREEAEQRRFDRARVVPASEYEERFVCVDDTCVETGDWLDDEEAAEWAWGTTEYQPEISLADEFENWWRNSGWEDCDGNDWPDGVHKAIDAAQRAIDANLQTVWRVNYGVRVVKDTSNAE